MRAFWLLWLLPTLAFAGEEDPAAVFRALETRLLEDDRPLWIQHRLTSSGAFEADLEGVTELRAGQWVEWTSTGSFGGEEVQIGVHSDGTHMSGGKYPNVYQQETAPFLREAVVIGMTRMGLLHNAARATGGAPPDHMEGGVMEWVQTTDHEWVEPATQEGVACRGIRFNLWVSSTPSGSATLWLSQRTGLPVARDQVVEFPQGEMQVRETYTVIEVGGQSTCPPCRQPIADYGYGVAVSHGGESIHVCCAGCAEKVADDWDGYRGILVDLGEAPATVDADPEAPVVRNRDGVGVCPPCADGLAERPEHRPAN